MSFHIYRIDRLADEKRLMEEKLKMENQIRKKREKNNKLKTAENEKYKRMFEPVTKSINEARLTIPAESAPIIKDEIKDENHEVRKMEEEKSSILYTTAIDTIPTSMLDDGVFGLFHTDEERDSGWIGNNKFHVQGNTLIAENLEDGRVKSFEIESIELWKLLLVKNPKKIHLNLDSDAGKEVLNEYRHIAKELDLLENAQTLPNYKNRAKYKLLTKKGKGFLFSSRPPPFHPSTIVIPSDKKGLLRALVKAVAELRAGNTSMQNIVVPLAQEAKRKRILPRKLLSPEEMTWVFA